MAGNVRSQHVVILPAELAAPNAKVETVLEGLSYSEGPAFDPEGNLFFSEDPDVQTGRIWKITPDGVKSVYKDPSRGSNGLEFDPQGRLVICMLDSLIRIEKDGNVTVLAAKSGTLNLGRVNDLSIASTGAMFFTNPGRNTLFFRSTDGQIKTRTFNDVNGVEWIEEKGIIYVASDSLQKCKVNNATGELSGCVNFAGGTDGLTTDANGNVYWASWNEGKVFVHDSTGKQLGSIFIDAKQVAGKRFTDKNPGNTSNCAFGGPDRKTLFITGDGGCYKVTLKVAGRVRPGGPSALGPGMRRGGAGTASGALKIEPVFAGPKAAGIYFLDTRKTSVAADGRRSADFLPASITEVGR
ncbi:MAG: SMP-30/gluconolactonase/LRE family protein [Fibrobacterota bacterium]|nr:SMP-30/gluconolactonase/LRE family protein [Fibrobacterota bacterium]